MISDLAIGLPPGWFLRGRQVIACEAPAGAGRRALLSRCLDEAAAGGACTWLLPCGFAAGGPWAGVRELAASLVASAEDGGDAAILRRHDFELVRVLPHLRRSLGTTREGLTETAVAEERVRNYPGDRALRLNHGLGDLFFALHAGAAARPAVIACDSFDAASSIATHFFVHLARRGERRLPLTLVLAGDPGAAGGMLAKFAGLAGLTCRMVGVRASRAGSADAAAPAAASDGEAPAPAAARATELEARAAAEPGIREILLPSLIRLWLAAGRRDRALPWLAFGLETYNVMGIYEEALLYGEQALAILKETCAEDRRLHLRIVAKLFYSYLATNRAEEALAFYLREAPREDYPPLQRARICYALAMVYARYLPQRDMGRGEALLEEGLRHLAAAELPPDEQYFEYVFNRNGLAMIRQFQGRPAEALALCREGQALLETHLRPEAHRLHRSVLVYNLAQVHAAMGATDEAIAQYTAVIAMDPHYSEYHNERGNAYLRQRRFGEALADYQRAIEVSPPYPEVFVNLGQCQRELGEMEGAVAAYSRALDLQSDLLLALLGRAQAYDASGDAAAAIADYSAALTLDPALWQARLNRGILHYGEGRLDTCLDDLDAAIGLAPQVAQLYRNRAVALADLGRNQDAVADLEQCLRLESEPQEREEVRQQLAALLAMTGLPRTA